MTDPAPYIRAAPIPLALLSGGEERVLVANPAFSRVLGTDEEALREAPLSDHFADAEAFRGCLAEVRNGVDEPTAVPMISAAGTSLLVTAWRVGEESRDRIGILLAAGAEDPETALAGTLRDVNEALLITALDEQAQAEEARAESEAKSVFLASVSHELRTPLNSILGYADLLDAGVPAPLPEGLESHVHRIRTAADHLLSLIEQIIEASRAEFDDRVDAEEFDVAAFLPDVLDLVRARAERAGLTLQLQRSTDTLAVVSDRRKVRQIILNLLVNAIKFTDEGRVRLELDHDDDTFTVRVIDTGIGISEEEQANVFRRFWQAGGSAVRTESGMGIGLWVVQTLVSAMGGTIRIDSAPGEGSTFEVAMPRRLEEARSGGGEDAEGADRGAGVPENGPSGRAAETA